MDCSGLQSRPASLHAIFPPCSFPRAVAEIKRYRDPSVCLSQPRRAAAPGYRHAGCLQLSHVRTADPSADGHRSAASRTAIAGGISSRRPRQKVMGVTSMLLPNQIITEIKTLSSRKITPVYSICSHQCYVETCPPNHITA